MSDKIKSIAYYPLFLCGFLVFALTGKTPSLSYLSFRKIFCQTNGKVNNWMSSIITFFKPASKIKKASGVLGDLSEADLDTITREIGDEGFYIFNTKLPDELCDDLIRFASSSSAKLVPNKNKLPEIVYDRNNPVAPKYQFNEINLVSLPSVQQLLIDQSILAIAQNYLKAIPINDSVTMWWSTNYTKAASSEAAQLYHFDMDRLKFLKFFVYLTDVTSQNGPHCYVRKSNHIKPKAVLRDGRISDNEIFSVYPEGSVAEICGPKGTILAVDTSGFHKGKPLEAGERLLFQIEFTNCLFGQSYNKVKLSEGSFSYQFINYAKADAYTFQRFRNS